MPHFTPVVIVLKRYIASDNSQFPRLSGFPRTINRPTSNTFLLLIRKPQSYTTLAALREWQFICLLDSIVRCNCSMLLSGSHRFRNKAGVSEAAFLREA